VVTGVVTSVDPGSNQITVQPEAGSSQAATPDGVTVPVGRSTRLTGPDNGPLSLDDLQPTATVTVRGLFNTRTSTYLRAGSVHETKGAIPLTADLAQPSLTPGSTQTLTVQTAPNAQVRVTVRFPNGETATAPAAVDGQGQATISMVVPLDAFSAASQTATASVAATVDGLTRSLDISFTIKLPRLALFVAKPQVRPGQRETVTVLTQTHVHVRLTVLYPGRRKQAHLGRANGNGLLVYRFTVPRDLEPGTALVRADRLGRHPATQVKQLSIR
jgi:hypothetical protein